MSVIPLREKRLTDADISAIVAFNYKLSEMGIAGACIPAELDDGARMVAILDTENEFILLGFGRDKSGYYVSST